MLRALPLWLTRVVSNSMAPGLRDGQLVLTLKPLRGHRFRRGAVVAVDSRELGRRIVKRIVGLPGERVRIEVGRIWVDGQILVEPYASASAYQGAFAVPEDHYLLLGDNRDASSDSRSWRNPYVGRDEIAGILIRAGAVRTGVGNRGLLLGRH
ncbi:signal peptidase I [Lysobacter maris]|uniref:Signal peptidase I n=1 Tax=Marilutibacter maris TaxID=1605891 RepID=A0A508B3I3_9GAMM|nr:signal peptidase I [Lysobacter maris]